MVFILTMLFLISVTVAVVLETIDAINKARGKPSHYARMLGYLGEGFEGGLCLWNNSGIFCSRHFVRIFGS